MGEIFAIILARQPRFYIPTELAHPPVVFFSVHGQRLAETIVITLASLLKFYYITELAWINVPHLMF